MKDRKSYTCLSVTSCDRVEIQQFVYHQTIVYQEGLQITIFGSIKKSI
jgi:hypothetical protein